MTVDVGCAVLVEKAASVGVIADVTVGVMFVPAGVYVGRFPLGLAFLGVFVDLGVAVGNLGGEVGQLIGIFVGFTVGDLAGISAPLLVGVADNGMLGSGVNKLL